MTVSERHAAAVMAEAGAALTTPITPSDLPPMPSGRIGAARAAAGEVLTGAQRELDRCSGELDRAIAAGHELERALADTQDSLDHVTRSLEDARTRAFQLSQRRNDLVATSNADLEAAEERREELAALESIVSQLDELSAGIIDRTMPDDDVAAFAIEVSTLAQVVGARGDEPGMKQLAATLEGWARQLHDRSAPLESNAATLLVCLRELDERWSASGAGDIFADPQVVVAQDLVERCRSALADLKTAGRSVGSGQHARTVIEQAHARRTELEDQGRRAGTGELDAAIAAETEALAHVGFDSMLDFQIVMSGRGTGALAVKRREVAEAELEAAEAELEASLRASTQAHEVLRTELDDVGRRCNALPGADPAVSTVDQLRGRLGVPEEVDSARAALVAMLDVATTDVADLEEAVARTTGELTANDDELQAVSATIATAPELVIAAEEALAAATVSLRAGDADIEIASQHRDEAAHARDGAAREVARLEALDHLDDDVVELGDALLAVVADRAKDATACSSPDGSATAVVLDDPLVHLDDETALRVFRRVTEQQWGVPVVYVTSRRVLLDAAPRDEDCVRCVNGRKRPRRERRWGRRHASTT